MSKLLDQLNTQQLKNIPDIRPGYTVKVHQKIKEGTKERIQIFEGIVIAKKHGKGISATITMRKVVEGVGVERIFPIHSPIIDKLEIVGQGKVRRAKLYFLRSAEGRKMKLKKKKAFAAAVVEVKSEADPVSEPEEVKTEESVKEAA